MSDYIDRQAAIDAIEKLVLPQTKGETMAEEINRVAWRCAINCAEEMIRHLPSAEVEPVKRGKWIEHYLEKWIDAPWGYNCSECGEWFVVGQEPIKRYHYCPNCGAKMEAAPTIIEAEGEDHAED